MKKTTAGKLKIGDVVIGSASNAWNTRPTGTFVIPQRIDAIFMQYRPGNAIKSDYMLRFSSNGREHFNGLWNQGTMVFYPDQPVWIN